MQVQPYLFFEGRCDEAAAFYQRAVGAEVTFLMRYKDAPEPPQADMVAREDWDKVMHMSLKIGATTVFASDGQVRHAPEFSGFALSLTVADEAEAEARFAALAEGGDVQMPMGPTFFSPRFGMLCDRFGVMWMVYVAH